MRYDKWLLNELAPSALGKASAWESCTRAAGSIPLLTAISHTTSQPYEVIGSFQVGVMEEKVKLSNLKTVDSAGSLYRKYQELLKAVQDKDELIGQLEAQLEKQVRTSVHGAPVPSTASAPAGPPGVGLIPS